jgi:hypothetical protein
MENNMYYSDGTSFKIMYDWVDPNKNSSPEESPYSFDAFYIWRDFDKENMAKNISVFYTDRMFQWDYEKAKRAFEGRKGIETLTKDDCIKITKKYFGNKARCVGYALCCNVSNGYPIGMLFIK